MSETSEPGSPTKLGWDFRKEMVVNLRGKLKLAFIAAGWKELLSENKAIGVYCSFCEDDQIITDLVNATLRSLIMEKCPLEEDKDLKSVLEAETQAFLTTVLESNQKHRKECITFMNKIAETFSSKYQRKLNTFVKITSSNSSDESNLQSFHQETTLKLFDEYDDAEKPGNIEFQNKYREQILERFERMFFEALTDHRKLAEERKNQIQDTIAKHRENYSRLLNEEAIKIQSTTELGQIHQTLSEATVQKFRTELSFLGTTQYNFAELKLTDSLNQAYQKILGELSAIIKKNEKIFQQQLEAGIVKYKSEMKIAIKNKPISANNIDLSVEHQRVLESVLSNFDSRLTNEEDSFSTKDLKLSFKQRLELKLLNKFAAIEKEWESNRHMVQLEVQDHFSNSGRIVEEALKKNICTAINLNDIESFCEIEVEAAKDRFHQSFPSISKTYREQQWKQFVFRIHEKTKKSIHQKLCQEELEAGVEKYKSEMMMVIKTKPVPTDHSGLLEEHRRVFKSVLSDFDSRLPKVDNYFTQDLKSTFKKRLEAKLLNEFASFEKEWETNCRTVKLEVQKHLSSSICPLQQALRKNTCTASKLEDIELFYRNEVAAAKDRFHQRFPNLSKKYRQQQWKQFISRLYEYTESFILDKMETKYVTQMRQHLSEKPYTHGDQLQVLHESISNYHMSQSNNSTLHQQLRVKLKNAYKNIQKEQEVKVSSKLSEAVAMSEKLLVSHSSEVFRRFCDGVMLEEIEVFRQEHSQQILQQYAQTLSWAESTIAYTNLLRELEIRLNTAFDKARLVIEQLERFYNEYYERKDFSNENVMIPREVCKTFHDKACSSAISKCIEENLLADEKAFKKESKTFLDKKYQKKLADATVIGIDFGMNYCKSAVYVNGKIQTIPHYDESGEEFSSMASYVGVGDYDGLVGQHAKSNVEKLPEFCHIIWDLKCLSFENITNEHWWIKNWCTWRIGENRGTISINGTNYLGATVVSKLFKKLKTNAEKFLNHSVNKCALTINPELDNTRRCDIVKEVELAGFTGIELLEKNWDSAVLLFKHIVNLQILKKKLVFLDFGSDFKFYALEVSETGCALLSCNNYGGGAWFLGELVEYCIRTLRVRILLVEKLFCTLENVDKNELDSDATFNYQKRRIYIACEKAIKALSLTQTIKVSVSNFYKGKELCAEITLAKMEEILNPQVTKNLEKFRLELSSAKLSLENIDEIIISGGLSRMPLIQKALILFFNGRPLNSLNIDPDEVIARGAAIKGAQLAANLIRTGTFKTT